MPLRLAHSKQGRRFPINMRPLGLIKIVRYSQERVSQPGCRRGIHRNLSRKSGRKIISKLYHDGPGRGQFWGVDILGSQHIYTTSALATTHTFPLLDSAGAPIPTHSTSGARAVPLPAQNHARAPLSRSHNAAWWDVIPLLSGSHNR